MTTEQTAQQLELAAKILRTGHPWEWQALDGEWVKPTIRTELHHVISDGLAIRLALATPPDGRQLHNPDNLTAEQVGVGWRLVAIGETLPEGYEFWCQGGWKKGYEVGSVVPTYNGKVSCRLPLSVPWPEAKPDPYAELKKAHVEGKVIEFWNQFNQDWESSPVTMAWCYPPERYRIKPESAFQPPPPPPGMQWHRTDGWQEDDLPQGCRPMCAGETYLQGDEWRMFDGWQSCKEDHTIKVWPRAAHSRTRRPLTFEHAGKQWTWHRPGSKMPCDGNRRVFWLYQICGECSESTEDTASHREWDWSGIIGWRYADEKKTVPFDISDVPPCSVLSLNPPRWFDIYGVCKEGIYVLDDEPLVETLWKWDYLAEKVKINRSIPLTGKWNPDAWEPCHKEVDA